MQFFQNLNLHVNVVSLFGLTLILGLIGGELAKRCYFLPRISGYIAVGFLVGPNLLNVVTPSLLAGSRMFVDISLGLILFDIGRHLDINWLRHDRGILYMAITESFLTFAFVFILFLTFHFSWLHSALVATIAMATSPAIIMMVADDFSSQGPVTRRTLILTSLNNLFALLIFNIILSVSEASTTNNIFQILTYRLFGSIALGIIICLLTLLLSRLIGKRKENQFVLLVGCIMFAIGVSIIFKFSSMLTLFTFGVAARNLNVKYTLMEVNFGWSAKLFFILLFVITGVHLQINELWNSILLIFSFILIRFLAKSSGIWLFARKCQLTPRQAWSLCFALTPMAALAIGMSNRVLDFNPDLGYRLMMIISTAVTIFIILGPIAVQLAFFKSNEALTETGKS